MSTLNHPLLTEHELIKGYIQQNSACQHMLFERFAYKMMGFGLRYALDSMEAEDMLKDAFVKVF